MAGKFITQYVTFEWFVFASLAGSNIECNQHLDGTLIAVTWCSGSGISLLRHVQSASADAKLKANTACALPKETHGLFDVGFGSVPGGRVWRSNTVSPV